MDQYLKEEKCRYLYYNLYIMVNKKRTPSSCYVREFFKTKKCDEFVDFSLKRMIVEDTIGTRTMERIVDRDDLYDEDTVRCDMGVNLFREQHKQTLWNALTWWDRIRYIYVEWPRELCISMKEGKE